MPDVKRSDRTEEGAEEEEALGVAMLGNGFMAKAHAKGLIDARLLRPGAPRVALVSICGRDEAALAAACERFGWQTWTTDWREQVNDPRVQLIHNTGPNALHVEPTLAAVRAGKHVLCEKPLAIRAEDAFAMWEAAVAAGVVHMCGFNFRFAPAARLAHELVRAGELGEVLNVRAQFLESYALDERAGTSWRDDVAAAGTGALGDLGSHVIDLVRWIAGELTAVQAARRSVRPQRAGAAVEVDDSVAALVELASGAGGVLEASRVAGGYVTRCAIELDGTLGTLRFSSEQLNDLVVVGRDRVARTIRATGASHPFMELWWPHPGQPIGWGDTFTHEVDHLLAAIAAGTGVAPLGASFEDGYRCAEVCDAIVRSAASQAREPIRSRDLAA
jgi:predicted dehydrogenase